MSSRIGFGYDAHRLVNGRELIIGGVKIPYDKGLLGHSDADVLLHALMDALLGAAALGDIGGRFPDSDDQYKGISSIKLLESVYKILADDKYAIDNIDVSVAAQSPKLAPYIDKMKENISKTLNIRKSQINIKATTTEKMGFEGREEGMSAYAVCMITRNEK